MHPLLLLSVGALVLGWVSFGSRNDKSVILLTAACIISVVHLLTVIGEVIEATMMRE